jgi:hypothetical protein
MYSPWGGVMLLVYLGLHGHRNVAVSFVIMVGRCFKEICTQRTLVVLCIVGHVARFSVDSWPKLLFGQESV